MSDRSFEIGFSQRYSVRDNGVAKTSGRFFAASSCFERDCLVLG
ncbi:hypothetical protein Natoc_2898 [Natronococcus occultus SP4]|uniref:Uncharacterized protein n=1 Tax=Natronococcus occultus SP4 TaxID=694430 RepID=L0K0Y2_9EURY|nr:hypothetical protein Natoc_2898 [Natronococcus occultus SP4]